MIDLEKIQKDREAAQAKLEELDAKLRQAQAERLKSLPQEVGLTTVDNLIVALAAHASPRMKGRLNKAFSDEPSDTPSKPVRSGRRKRVRLDEAAKEKIKTALKDAKDKGNRTAADIAEEFGVSTATVNLIKKAAGLTVKRK